MRLLICFLSKTSFILVCFSLSCLLLARPSLFSPSRWHKMTHKGWCVAKQDFKLNFTENDWYFCVACVAWQTHRDHVVRWRRCLRHTFRFRSITFEGMYWFHSNIAELYITIKYRSRDIGNHLPNFGWVVALFQLSFCCLFPLNDFWRDALYITVKYRPSSILIIIRKILAELWPFFNLVFVGVLILVSYQ